MGKVISIRKYNAYRFAPSILMLKQREYLEANGEEVPHELTLELYFRHWLWKTTGKSYSPESYGPGEW